jgi:hypothetical protein
MARDVEFGNCDWRSFARRVIQESNELVADLADIEARQERGELDMMGLVRDLNRFTTKLVRVCRDGEKLDRWLAERRARGRPQGPPRQDTPGLHDGRQE